ncbi:MAG: hypothetical protein KF855_03725 [Acidobacteria bacterium]|nr:hypothetical protein [Acidobacteriota bacterium]
MPYIHNKRIDLSANLFGKVMFAIGILTILVSLSQTVMCQSEQLSIECPSGYVCITREAAISVLEKADKADALEKEALVKDQAIADLKQLLADIKIDLARMSGEKTQLEADKVRWTAVIDLLLKNARPKKNGLINF